LEPRWPRLQTGQPPRRRPHRRLNNPGRDSRPIASPEKASIGVDDPEAAVGLAIRILNAAAQTRSGLERKLARAGFTAGAVDVACDRVEAMGNVNDRAYAEATLERRRRQGRGLKVIAAELRQKGIDRELVDELIGTVTVEDEVEGATELARKLLERQPDRPRRSQKVTAALLRRGYAPGVARKALEKASG
jgi:regulatory protein